MKLNPLPNPGLPILHSMGVVYLPREAKDNKDTVTPPLAHHKYKEHIPTPLLQELARFSKHPFCRVRLPLNNRNTLVRTSRSTFAHPFIP